MGFIKEYLSALIQLTSEMSPYLLLGFLIAGILHVFFRDEKIARLLGANNIKSVLKAALIGIPLPLCSCGVIPTAVSLYKRGASKGSTVSFLISTPQTGIDSIMVTYSLIGLPFAIIRVIIALVTGLLGGIITNLFTINKKVENIPLRSVQEIKKQSLIKSFIEIFRYAFFDFIKDISKWLVIGLLIAAFITVLVPDDFFSTYIQNKYLNMFIILGASIPLYVCATGSVPIAAALIMKGISPGAALVFLMAGPATNAATITVISKTMGKRTLISYLGSIIVGALLFGILTDLLFPEKWLTGFLLKEHIHHEHELLPIWFKSASSILLTTLVIYSLFSNFIKKILHTKKKYSNTHNTEPEDMMKQVKISVKGMSCSHCKTTIENGLKQFPGIASINADLLDKSVTISGEHIDLEAIRSTIESLGYKYDGRIL